jgi:hypothetical protein
LKKEPSESVFGRDEEHYLFRNKLTSSTYKIYNRGMHYVYFLVEAKLSDDVRAQRDVFTYYELE